MGFSFAKPSRHLLSQKKDISDLALGPVPYITMTYRFYADYKD